MAHIEFHHENGHAPHVVVIPMSNGGRWWIAYPTEQAALQKLPLIEHEFSRFDGIIETTDAKVDFRT